MVLTQGLVRLSQAVSLGYATPSLHWGRAVLFQEGSWLVAGAVSRDDTVCLPRSLYVYMQERERE